MKARGLICHIDGCDRDVTARQMCVKHYLRWSRYGDPSMNKRPNSFTGQYVTNTGYVMIHLGGNIYRGEHALMAEKALGKPLPAKAEIHHIDGDKSNNNNKSPWNLVLCPNHSYHMLLHRRAQMLGYEAPWSNYKLTSVQIKEISESKTSQREAAKLHGVSISTIARIRKNHSGHMI